MAAADAMNTTFEETAHAFLSKPDCHHHSCIHSQYKR
jgi:hypothetical protein